MANITTATNGTFQPVSNMDTGTTASSPGAGWPTPLNSVTSGTTVNVAGPKLDFGTITFTGNTTVSGASLNLAMLTIQTKCTIAMYEFTTNSSNTATLALATYPTGAWDYANAGDLDAAVTAALGYAVTTAATATFTN
jgi:hypothetical protein